MAKISPRKQGYTTEWDKARRIFLRAHPLCASCDRPANVVDHIQPHKGDMDLFWNESNWQPMCKPCHDRKTATEDSGFARRKGNGCDEFGNPIGEHHWNQ